jgi:tRNA (adenine57-N1/adenine58-N1)-methyltransferase
MTAAGPALRAGERALLIDGRGRRYLIRLTAGAQWHSHMGTIEHDTLIGAPEGTWATASGGARLLAFRPTLADYILKMQRGAQVVYPKDIALIVTYGDIFPGARVLEAGTGSGALTMGLARAAGESGRVVSYEIRPDHLERARDNLAAWSGPTHTVELRSGDIFAGVPDPGFHRMVLDLPEPWHALETATDALVAGGIIVCYLPTVPQVQQTADALRGGGFVLVNVFEGLVRTWTVEGRSVRPDHRMVAHTGFIITARKPTN